MSTEGDISINLRMDDKDFVVSVQNSGKLLRQLRGDLLRTADAATKTERHFNSFSGHFKSFMMTVAATRFALMDIHQVFLTLPGAVIKASGEIERMTKLMAGLSKETDELKRKQEALKDTQFVFNMAKNAPFEVKALGDAFVKLKTVGLDPTSGSMQVLVDSVAKFGGSSEHLKRASVAIQQMVGKGVVSMEELRQQLGEAVPDAMQAMAIGTGMSMGELVDKISKGTVEAKTAIERMFAVMRVQNDGAALKMMDSWVGQLERLKTNLMLLGNDIGNGGGFFQEVTSQLKALNAAFDSPEVKKFATEVSVMFADAARMIAAVAQGIVKYSDEIVFAGKALLAIWGGSKLVSAINGIRSAYQAFVTTYVAGVRKVVADERMRAAGAVANMRQEVISNAVKNAQIIADNARAAATQLAADRAKHATLAAEAAAFRAQERAASVASIRAIQLYGDGGRVYAAQQRQLAIAYGERASAAERMAARIKAAEAGLLATSTGTMAAMRANTVAAQTALAGLGTAATATASKVAVLRGAINLLGGPIGVITTLLTAGVFAWMQWGNSAGKAADAAAEALARVKAGYASLADVQVMSQGIAALEEKIANNRKRLAILPESLSGHIREQMRADQKQIAELKKNLSVAAGQGQDSSVASSVGVVARQTEALINAKRAETNRLYQADLEAARERRDNKQITEEQFAAEERKIVKKAAEESARHKVSVHQAQIDIINKRLADIDKGAYNGANPALAKKGFEAQLLQQTEALKAAREEMRVATQLDTPTKLLDGKGKGDGKGGAEKLTEYQKAVQSLEQDIAGINAELNKKGSGTFVEMLESFKNKGIKGDELKRVTALVGEAMSKTEELARGEEITKYAQQAKDMFAGLSEEAEGGSKKIGKLRDRLIALLDTARSVEEHDEITKALKLVDDSASLELQKKYLDSQAVVEDYRQKVDQINVGMTSDYREQLRLRYEAEVAAEAQKLELRIASAKAVGEGADKEMAGFLEWQQARFQQFARDSRTPMQQLVEEWSNATAQMERASTGWANSTIDEIMKVVKGGKADWRSLVGSMVEDMARINLQKTLGSGMQMAFDGAVSWVGKNLFGEKGNAAGGETAAVNQTTGALKKFWNALTGAEKATGGLVGAAGQAAQAALFGATQGMTQAQATLQSTTALIGLTNAAHIAAQALAMIAMSASSGGGSGLGQAVFSAAVGAVGSFSTSGWGAESWGAAMGTSYGTNAFSQQSLMLAEQMAYFANGGIMTEAGSVPLRKYANGGVANFPQAAIFAEGSMAEAFVPLPDGRSIPVTMDIPNGAGGTQSVVISIVVNNDGTEQQSNNGDDKQKYAAMADRVKGIVKEELVKQKRPGGLLYT